MKYRSISLIYGVETRELKGRKTGGGQGGRRDMGRRGETWEGGKRRQGGEKEKGRGNLAPTVISKSRRYMGQPNNDQF